ncbi:MAG: ProQ/FinO family protein [Legionellaceae bacterium]|nr:ProQ/FinO family protein [Legionellaceae bacterium]MBP9775303.1 ProQ/FinO family protein [Legionellaceae bacterium]
MRKQIIHPRTAAINQKQKNHSKKSRLDALHWLQSRFPAAFDNRTQIRPLNVGIMNEILRHAEQTDGLGISKSKLREAVVLYTRRLDYLACLKARELRVDLMGNPSVRVSDEEAERAAAKIKKRIEKTIKNSKKLTTGTPEISARAKIIEIMPRAETERLAADPIAARSVSVTHKQSRAYDPQVVARLKEKLGLSQQKNELEDA